MREGWEIKTLKSIGRTQTGTTPPTNDASNYGDYIPFVKPAHFNKNGEIVSVDSGLSEIGLSKGRLFEEKSVLMVCIGATIGKVGFCTIPVSSNQQINVLTPKEDCDYKFLYYGMTSPTFQTEILKIGASAQATLPIINKSKWENLTLPIPPLSEQKEIVAILDQAFEAIDQAKANIEKNIVNAKELFQSKLNDIFSQKGDGWEDKTILELCEHKSQIVGGPFGSNLKVSDYKESGIPILRLQNIGKGYFIDKDIKFVSQEKADELAYHSFNAGDIVLAKLGIPIGKTCIVPERFEYGIVVADVVRIRPNKQEINYDFLKHFLNSDNAVNQLTADIKGATRPRVNIPEVRNLKLSVPALSKQDKITQLIDNIECLRNKQIEVYEKKLCNLEELKKSILQRAFAGELTSTGTAITKKEVVV